MNVRKSDWALVIEAERDGLAVGMTGLVERNRTDLNNELNEYFRSKLPSYSGSYSEEEGEVLDSINTYLATKNIKKKPLDFPLSNGTEIHLIPITKNLQLKVLIVDEYYGDGDYEKYIMINFFIINEATTKHDVNELVAFLKQYVLDNY